MTGLMPVTNCRCLALVDRSYTRKTTKLAGTNDMATMMKMEISTSDPSSLQNNKYYYTSVGKKTLGTRITALTAEIIKVYMS